MKYIKAMAMRINELLQIKGITEEEFIRKSKLPKETAERLKLCSGRFIMPFKRKIACFILS